MTFVRGLPAFLWVNTAFLLVLFIFAFRISGLTFALSTLLLLVLVSLVAYLLANSFGHGLSKNRLHLIFGIWILSETISVVLTILFPNIYESDLFDLAVHQSQTGVFDFSISSINYPGSIYFYGIVFHLFGENPLALTLVNTLLIYTAVLLLFRIMTQVSPVTKKSASLVFAVLAVPQIVIVQTQLGKEVLVVFLCTVLIYLAWRMAVSVSRGRIKIFVALFISCLALALVRTSALAVMSVAVLIVIYISRESKKNKFRILCATATLLVITLPFGYFVSGMIGGYKDLGSYAGSVLEGRLNEDYFPSLAPIENLDVGNLSSPSVNNLPLDTDGTGWSENSLGELLSPRSTLEVFLFAAPRTILNLSAPLGSKEAWHRSIEGDSLPKLEYFSVLITGVILISITPLNLLCVLATFSLQLRLRALSVFWVPALLAALSIGLGTTLIHERYRIFAIPFLVASAVAGWSVTSSRTLIRAYSIFGMMIIVGGLFLFAYKYL